MGGAVVMFHFSIEMRTAICTGDPGRRPGSKCFHGSRLPPGSSPLASQLRHIFHVSVTGVSANAITRLVYYVVVELGVCGGDRFVGGQTDERKDGRRYESESGHEVRRK